MVRTGKLKKKCKNYTNRIHLTIIGTKVIEQQPLSTLVLLAEAPLPPMSTDPWNQCLE